jgi:hydroxyacylglutathione hydrolase
MSVFLKQLALGPMQNYVYLLGDPETKEAAVIDPAWNVPAILEQVKEDGYRLTHVLLTHGHYDHINGVEEIVKATDATVVAEAKELDDFVFEGMGGLVIPRSSLKKTFTGDRISIGRMQVQAIVTPGHTPGSQCYWVRGKTSAEDVVVTGDTLFVGTIGRCDFPYSSPRDLFHSLGKLKKLQDETTIYPGHDYGSTSHDTLAHEKKTNPFLMAKTIEDFLQLVRR